jgi:peroxiredoxin Q/BCP
MSIRSTALIVAAFGGAGGVVAQAHAQAPAVPESKPLEIGAVAPDFTIPGATQYGVLKDPVKLSDFKGKAVVLAFFFKARTKG